MSDNAQLAAAHKMLSEYKSRELLGITQDRQVAALMVAFASDTVARLRAVEAERDAEKREVDRLNGHLQAYQGKLVKAQADAQRLTAEVERLKGDVSNATLSLLDLLQKHSQAEARERALVEALQVSTSLLEYWFKNYRDHSGFMNATHLSERDSLVKRLAANHDVLQAAAALTSIAKNTCCESCQEAALVAQRALDTHTQK